MAAEAREPHEQTQAPETAHNMAEWYEVYYTPLRAANTPAEPTLSALEQMYAYYDA